MPLTYGASPSAGSSIKVSIASVMVIIKGADGIPPFGATKATYDTTTIVDTAKTFMDDVPDNGEITITGPWDSTDPGQAHLEASANAMGVTDAFEVDFTLKPGAATAAKATFSGLVLTMQKSAVKGKPQTFSSKIKLTGPVTLTAAA